MMDNVQQEAQALFERTRGFSRESREEQVKAAPEAVRRAYWAIQKDSYFTPENARPDRRREHQSPSGRYRLVVTPYDTGKGYIGYTQGCVFEGDRLIAEIRRNYSAFPFAWVESHAVTGGDYLIGGEDYQGQSVVDLRSGEVRHSLPEEAHDGVGFCWAQIHPSPSGRLLAVDGCYWACPYEVVFYDFSDPMNMPWIEIDRNEGYQDFLGWDEGDQARVGRRFEMCILEGPLYGKDCAKMTDDELTVVMEEAKRRGCDEDDLYEWSDDTREERWVQPPWDQVARKAITQLEWRREQNLFVLQGWVQHIDQLLGHCDPQDRAAIETELANLLAWLRANVREAS
jgi:hypothetical protein